MNREQSIDREVTRRLAEALSSAGVPVGRVSLEVLYLLPEEFVRAYVQLFHLALKEDVPLSSYGERASHKKLVNEGHTIFVGRMSKRRRHRVAWTVKDEAAFEAKRRVDRKLRRLTRDIQEEISRTRGIGTRRSGEPSEEYRLPCPNCQKELRVVLEALGGITRAKFCPFCGKGLKLEREASK